MGRMNLQRQRVVLKPNCKTIINIVFLQSFFNEMVLISVEIVCKGRMKWEPGITKKLFTYIFFELLGITQRRVLT